MTDFTPGTLVGYRASNSLSPPWPAVVCTDDIAPEAVLKIRPNGYAYVTLVLLMGEGLTFRWARTIEMSAFDPCVPFEDEDTVGNTPGLGDAYEIANDALAAGLNLEHWREHVSGLITVVSDSEYTGTDSEEEACSDLELKRAIRASREHYRGKRPEKKSAKRAKTLQTPSLSPKHEAKIANDPFTIVSLEKTGIGTPFASSQRTSRDPTSRSSQHLRQRESCRTPPSSLDKKAPFPGMDSVKRLTGDISAVHQTAEKTAKLNPFPQRSFLDDFCGRLNQNLKEPTSDIVDGELSESKDFVQILIGPTNEISTLAKQSVWNRPYWRDPRRGINHFDMNEDGIWELRHPGLDEIESEDFVFVAEYLESGDFGYRRPQGGEDMEEAVAQCMSAWFAAERLDMSDLMDYIVEKLQKRIEPAMYDVMVFACQIYNSPDTGLPSYQWLKDYLATSIAENYWIYLSDDHLSSSFIEKLQLFPELERDIYMRRLVALEQRLEPEDDDQNEGDAEMS